MDNTTAEGAQEDDVAVDVDVDPVVGVDGHDEVVEAISGSRVPDNDEEVVVGQAREGNSEVEQADDRRIVWIRVEIKRSSGCIDLDDIEDTLSAFDEPSLTV